MALTRRAILGGGLAAAAWRLGPVRAEAPAPSGRRISSVRGGALAPGALSRRRADPAATLAYAGATPGPLLRLKEGEELKLRLVNKLAEPTALSFPGLRTANASAGYGGLTGPRLAPGASADIRFAPPDSGLQPLSAPWRSDRRRPAGPRPVRADPRRRGRKARRRSRTSRSCCRTGASTSAARSRTISPIPPSPAAPGARRGLIFANGAAAPLALKARPGARVRLQARQCGDGAADQYPRRRRKNAHRRGRRSAERAVRAAAQPVPDGARSPLRTHVRPAALRRMRRQLHFARSKRLGGSAVRRHRG